VIRRDELEKLDLLDATTGETLPNVTPGEVLKLEFLEPLRLSARALARDMGVPANRVTEILSGARAVSAETAILLGRRLGTSAEFWLNLQMAHDLEEARRRMGIAA
jgi:addiction module HigA family antidote